MTDSVIGPIDEDVLEQPADDGMPSRDSGGTTHESNVPALPLGAIRRFR